MLEEVYRAWFASLEETDLNRDRIISQDDRLVLALSNQSSLDREHILVDDLNYLFDLRDRIRSNQPNWFEKLLMFFKGWNVIVRNKYEIELVILKTYYQLNRIDSIKYPQSLILDQTKKIESWRKGYDVGRFSERLPDLEVTSLDIDASELSDTVLNEIRDFKSYKLPQAGMQKWITKIVHENSMILDYGTTCGPHCGSGETLLIKANQGKIEHLVAILIRNIN